jgi:hypothetical protein
MAIGAGLAGWKLLMRSSGDSRLGDRGLDGAGPSEQNEQDRAEQMNAKSAHERIS